MTFKRKIFAIPLALSTVLLLCSWGIESLAFSFSEEEEKLQREEQQQREQVQSEIRHNLDTRCPISLKNQKILLLVSEKHFRESYPYSQIFSNQTGLYQPINQALGRLGFRTYSQQQITGQIAEAELQAVANGDLDAAINAASRLAADYVLRASISSRSGRNPMIGVKEVTVNISLDLQTAAGHLVGATSAHSESFSGDDALSTAKTMVREQADSIASRLYRDLCQYASRGNRKHEPES